MNKKVLEFDIHDGLLSVRRVFLRQITVKCHHNGVPFEKVKLMLEDEWRNQVALDASGDFYVAGVPTPYRFLAWVM